jgi:hypothetical protein
MPPPPARYLEECLPKSQYWDVPVDAQTEAASSSRIIEFLSSAACHLPPAT